MEGHSLKMGEMNRNVECGRAYFGSGEKGIGM